MEVFGGILLVLLFLVWGDICFSAGRNKTKNETNAARMKFQLLRISEALQESALSISARMQEECGAFGLPLEGYVELKYDSVMHDLIEERKQDAPASHQ